MPLDTLSFHCCCCFFNWMVLSKTILFVSEVHFIVKTYKTVNNLSYMYFSVLLP